MGMQENDEQSVASLVASVPGAGGVVDAANADGSVFFQLVEDFSDDWDVEVKPLSAGGCDRKKKSFPDMVRLDDVGLEE